MSKKLSLFTKPKLSHNRAGMVLITSLLIFMLLTFVALSLADLTIAQYGRTTRNVSVSNSLLTAEAGVEQSLYELNEDSNFAGFAETEFFNNETQGRGTYQSTVTAGSGPNEKIITTTGRVYRHNETTNPISERSIKVTAVGTSSTTNSVYAGAGGLTLSGGTTITGTGVYVNGTISISGGSDIGSPSQPIPVNVAHYSCPTGSNPGPTYPQQCTTADPISFDVGSYIYGPVCATNQVKDRVASWQNPPALPNLQPNCEAPFGSMPTYDRAGHIAAVTTTASSNNSLYTCSGGQSKTWPANLQLNGNVNPSGGCTLTITGNVYITGNLQMNGGATIRIADSLGTTRPVIMVDGTITASGGARLLPNSSGTSAHFITFRSAASCSPNCTTVTGSDLKASEGQTNININGGGNFPGALFHAYWSRVNLSGGGTTGSAIGQAISLSGGGTLTFGTGLSSGESVWTIRSYQQIFD